jgi:hypothetical protein
MIVVHFAKVSALYPRVVISSLAKRLENLIFVILTLPLVYDPEITTCCYKGLLHEYVMLCYDFPIKDPTCSAKVSPAKAPSCTMWAWVKYHANPHSSEQDTLPIIFLISKQVVPYWIHDSTCSPRVSTPKIRSSADSSNHITWRS